MKKLTGFVAAVALVLTAACGQSDSGVTTRVKAKFAQDNVVKAHEINVTTREGVVTLTGEVDSADAKRQAVRLARETQGVTQVIDELRVEGVATTGDLDDAIQRGAEETADAARKAGEAVRDAVTDKDRDSDRDGK
jgi:BON domain